jgi:hypothetical protein
MIGILIVFAVTLLVGISSQSLPVMIGILIVFAVTLLVGISSQSLPGSTGMGTGSSTGTGPEQYTSSLPD